MESGGSKDFKAILSLFVIGLLIILSLHHFKADELICLWEKAKTVENSNPTFEFKDRGNGSHWEVTYNVREAR